MPRLKNKQTGIVSSYTDKQLADLKNHPQLLKLFDVLDEHKEPTPPEVQNLKGKGRSTKKITNEQKQSTETPPASDKPAEENSSNPA